jgi:hypothetical protein
VLRSLCTDEGHAATDEVIYAGSQLIGVRTCDARDPINP